MSWYFFMFLHPNAMEKNQELKSEGMVLAKVKAVGCIIIILHHLGSSTLKLNIVAQNVNIDPIYLEFGMWDVCINFKEAQSP